MKTFFGILSLTCLGITVAYALVMALTGIDPHLLTGLGTANIAMLVAYMVGDML
jgi:hypothetical protein